MIVVDDGSTDSTRQVLEKYRERIKYIYQENAACAAVRNTGIRNSSGQWIAFIDSDDRWHPKYLEWQLKSLEHFSTKVSVANILPDYDGKADFDNLSFERPLTDDLLLITDPLEITLVKNELASVTFAGNGD